MAKFGDGLFGKIGNVVIAHWKGKQYIRSRPSGNPSNTKAQQNQRSKFGMVVKFVGRILPVINAGFKWRTDEMTERNAAISYLMKNAVTGEKPDLSIIYPNVMVARGDLPPPKQATVERMANHLVFSWVYCRNRPADRVLALAYSTDLEKGVWSIGAARRADESVDLELPDNWAGKEVHAYLAFAALDGSDASDSVYVGRV
ncbi:MAG: DUF6266 family protein [Bacteroidota bacterium]